MWADCDAAVKERSQRADAVFCNGRFSQLVARCSNPFAGLLDTRSGRNPFGLDPAFNPSSSLFNSHAAANPGLYYNTSPGSPEISALGNPYGFFPAEYNTSKAPFVLVFPVSSAAGPTPPQSREVDLHAPRL